MVALVPLEPLQQLREVVRDVVDRGVDVPRSVNLAGTVRTVSSRGSASGSSSHSSGVETGACGSGRTE